MTVSSWLAPHQVPRPTWSARAARWGGALLWLALAGCSSLAPFEPARVATTSPELMGARGPLSPARSKAILDRLAAQSPETGFFERHLAIEQALVGSPLMVGNDATLLQDGPDTYRAMYAAIEAAHDHINLETYIFDDDEVGREFAQALIDKQRAGVQVNLIYDSVGAINTPRAFFDRLTEAGVRVLEFNPVNPANARKGWQINQRDHRKLLIVDGEVAFLGGINISGVYASGAVSGWRVGSAVRTGMRAEAQSHSPAQAWRDVHVQLQGPVVAEYQRLFLATWAKQQGDPLPARRYFPTPQVAGTDVVRAIGSSADEPYSFIYATFLSALAAADRRVWVTMAYFAPDPQFLAALEAAARRGVDVRLILPSQTDAWLVFHAGRRSYARLLKAGVKLYERRDVVLHAKTAVIDGVWATIGSTNLDWRSFLHNDELNAVVLGPDFAGQMEAMFEADLAASTPIELQAWRERPLSDRVKELLAGVIEYWL